MVPSHLSSLTYFQRPSLSIVYKVATHTTPRFRYSPSYHLLNCTAFVITLYNYSYLCIFFNLCLSLLLGLTFHKVRILCSHVHTINKPTTDLPVLVHRRYSINISWMNDWLKEWISEEWMNESGFYRKCSSVIYRITSQALFFSN